MADVSVTLPSAIVYVTGTVNGVTVTFTLSGTNTWAATCATSSDDIYIVAIEALDGAGNVSNYNITLYYGLHLITDRTAADVANKTIKGFYNATDLNRVAAAIKFVSDIINTLPDELKEYAESLGVAWDSFYDVPYTPFTATPKADWAIQDIPIDTQMSHYLDNLEQLRLRLVMINSSADTIPTTMNDLTHIMANDIELMISDLNDALGQVETEIKTYLVNVSVSWVYSGEVYSGEV